ncbi:unnamed protein product [Cuscuta europaea]|uniref:Uncharacterized protein n=1 Tax=Cuscuta europaea TaxID=41803 RepID=A0A9P0ZX79_CUSEU|nr:unnamed protein product [Cuscuta europaea]
MSSSRRGVNWSVKEDVVLCNRGRLFGAEFTRYFRHKVMFLELEIQIQSRFKIINNQCSLWKVCVRKTNATPRSGSNLEDLNFQAKDIFMNDNNGKAFKFEHAWRVLQCGGKENPMSYNVL